MKKRKNWESNDFLILIGGISIFLIVGLIVLGLFRKKTSIRKCRCECINYDTSPKKIANPSSAKEINESGKLIEPMKDATMSYLDL